MSDNTPYEGVSKYMLLLCTTGASWCTRKEQYQAVGTKKGNSEWYTYTYTNDVDEACTLTVGDVAHNFKIINRGNMPPPLLCEAAACNLLKEDPPQSISGADIAKMISKANPKIKPHLIYPPLQPRANVFDEYNLAMSQPMNAVSALPSSANPIIIQPGSIKQTYRGI